MAEVMLEEIGRRPGAAPKEEEEAAPLGGGLANSSGLHRVCGGGLGRVNVAMRGPEEEELAPTPACLPADVWRVT